jgi:hypothetical protein
LIFNGYLLPTNLWVCIQSRRRDPDLAKINRVMGNFFFVVGVQGTMQALTIVIMARLCLICVRRSNSQAPPMQSVPQSVPDRLRD